MKKNADYLDLANEFHKIYSNFKSEYDVDYLEYAKEIEKQKQKLISNEIEKISKIENSNCFYLIFHFLFSFDLIIFIYKSVYGIK